MRNLLLCPPDHYGIEYEINPWMNRSRASDRDVAVEQWNNLRALIEAAGAKVDTLTPQQGLPDLVFTANAALIYRRTAILSRRAFAGDSARGRLERVPDHRGRRQPERSGQSLRN